MSKKNDPVVVAYEEYKQQCAGLSIAPCDFVGWQIYAVQLDEHHLPYLTNYPNARKASSKRSGCAATFRQSRRVWSGMDSADAIGVPALVVNQVLPAAQCIAG